MWSNLGGEENEHRGGTRGMYYGRVKRQLQVVGADREGSVRVGGYSLFDRLRRGSAGRRYPGFLAKTPRTDDCSRSFAGAVEDVGEEFADDVGGGGGSERDAEVLGDVAG